MRNKLSRFLVLAAGLAVSAAPAAAQVLPQLPNYPLPTTGKMLWNGVNSSMSGGVVGCYSGPCYYVGPYSAKFSFTGATPTGPAYDIFCVDFAHHVNTSTYNINLTNVFSGNMLKTRVQNQAQYMKAAWLADKFTSANTASWRNIHGAIWNIMYGTPPADAGITAEINLANAAASGGYVGFDFSKWTVVTQQGAEGVTAEDGRSQEFLVRNSVPEPATLLLFGTGLMATLIAAGGFRRPDA